MFIRIYTDGGARGNPGPAASAAVLKLVEDGVEGKTVDAVSRYLGHTTNNQAEYTAIIIGLERAKELGAQTVEVYMDSELAMRQLNGQYKVRNPDLAARVLSIYQLRHAFDMVRFVHIPRAKNEEADALVNKTLDAHMSKK